MCIEIAAYIPMLTLEKALRGLRSRWESDGLVPLKMRKTERLVEGGGGHPNKKTLDLR